MTENDPYRPPEAELVEPVFAGDRPALASRGARLAAAIVDLICVFVAVLPMFIGVALLDRTSDMAGAIAVALSGLLILTLLVVQLVLLAQNSWTIGKRLLGIRIVRTDYSRAGLGRLLLLRMFVPGLIGIIPLAGACFSLVDPLFIFGEERRCLHDYMADTIVVEA